MLGKVAKRAPGLILRTNLVGESPEYRLSIGPGFNHFGLKNLSNCPIWGDADGVLGLCRLADEAIKLTVRLSYDRIGIYDVDLNPARRSQLLGKLFAIDCLGLFHLGVHLPCYPLRRLNELILR